MYSLEDLGWDTFFQSQIQPGTNGLLPARVAEEQRGAYLLLSAGGPLNAGVPGRMMHEATGRHDFPAVGDWVLAQPLPGGSAIIRRTLERRTKLSRKTAGERTEEQIMAANVDVVFLVASLNAELNLRRIERYLAVIYESGARPVVVLNKADLAPGARALASRVELSAPGVETILTSAATGEGVDALGSLLTRGRTVVFVGSSGVGKSSLVNLVLGGNIQAVRDIRADDKGRHTTTSRQMLMTPGGALIIDTPGLRELQLWDADEGVGHVFSDVEELAGDCAFVDCAHGSEPGCAVRHALDEGALDHARFESYLKLQREQRFIQGKRDFSIRNAEKKKWKDIHKANRQRMKLRGR